MHNPEGGYIKIHTRPNNKIRAAPWLPPPLLLSTQTPYLAPIAVVRPWGGGAVFSSLTHNPSIMPNFIACAVKLDVRKYFWSPGLPLPPFLPSQRQISFSRTYLASRGAALVRRLLKTLSVIAISLSHLPQNGRCPR